MDFMAVLGVAGTVIGLLSAGTAIVAFARASYAKATIDALRGDVRDRDTRIDFLEDENTRTKAALKRIGEENDTLRGLVTNRAELRELVDLSKKHEEQADKRHNEILAMDEQILTGLTALASAMNPGGKK